MSIRVVFENDKPKEQDTIKRMYFDLLEKSLTNHIYDHLRLDPIKHVWSYGAHTGITIKSLQNIRYCAEVVFEDNIPGDFVEAGIWRGGPCMYMAAIVKAYQQDRQVWGLDSFQGLPKPTHEKDTIDFSMHDGLAVSLEEVKKGLVKYDLDKIEFIEGWFNDTIDEIVSRIDLISILRLDSDYYESTKLLLNNLYSKVPIGGFVIIDDYELPPCELAIAEFKKDNNITEPLYYMDSKRLTGAFWRKSRMFNAD